MPRTDLALIVPYQEISAFGPRVIDAALRAKGFDSRLIFFKSRSQEECWPSDAEIALLTDLVRELEPRLVGFSLMSPFFALGKALAQAVRQAWDAPVAFGGVHPTISPEECIEAADICCVGEGEIPLERILASLRETGRVPGDVPNCWVRLEDGVVVKNPVTCLRENLDELPFDPLTDEGRYFIENGRLERKDPYLDYIRSRGKYSFKAFRGCPFFCTYCGNKALMDAQSGAGRFHRHRGVENVVAELEDVLRRFPMVRTIHSYDEVFIHRPEYVRDFAREYKRRIGLPFTCDAHLNLLSDETVGLMAQAGLVQATVGIEAFSDDVRQNLYKRKGMGTEHIVEKARILHRHGVLAHYDFIWDNPLESAEDIRRCFFELVLRLPRPLAFNNYSLTFLPGSELTEHFLARGLIRPEHVAGRSDKGLVQWKLTMSYPRPPEVTFWFVMFSLYAFSFRALGREMVLPKLLVSLTARTGSLFLARNVLRAATLVKLACEGGLVAELRRKLLPRRAAA
ncbi:2-hydroxyethylphosphonate methyltransferase [Fundidesulfovibrio magnetotacticus]|uniref:2-hydroxyethylphosphonate methyltransferase n=1 Tax=Fundidesulfovibrio magnetotacticus TaxID=2730080 RepID=A0A6V8LYV6_9BACT|nr:radical SAM protein [Fundidesulfovibrio magnetotacticus]GFK94827.1 2-hydroxyethylphosphonate methyltransferase [Fundidesulfovibrio magnetotacticus]